MATINISDLRPTDSDLFSDDESYMNELSERELSSINGGCGFWCSVGASLVANALWELGMD
jgi:lactobin A/cerein 7B family class IIb bacteriocin